MPAIPFCLSLACRNFIQVSWSGVPVGPSIPSYVPVNVKMAAGQDARWMPSPERRVLYHRKLAVKAKGFIVISNFLTKDRDAVRWASVARGPEVGLTSESL